MTIKKIKTYIKNKYSIYISSDIFEDIKNVKYSKNKKKHYIFYINYIHKYSVYRFIFDTRYNTLTIEKGGFSSSNTFKYKILESNINIFNI